MKLETEKKQPVVARVYDILNCGPHNRFVANNKLVHNSGSNKINAQNLPRGSILRNSFVAPNGHQFIVADLAQIEARVLAWLAREEQILDIFRNKRDLYSEVASKIYNRPINKKDNPEERWVGKTSALGLNYGMGAVKFNIYCALQDRSLSPEFTQKVVDTYRTTYSKLPIFWNTLQSIIHLLAQRTECAVTKELTIINDCIYLPSGRFLRYEGVHWDDTMWRLINGKRIYGPMLAENITQSLSRDILCDHILAIHPHYPIVMHTHDELITIVPDNQVNEATEFITQTMTTAPTWAPDLPLNIDINHGKRYGDCK